MIIYTRSNPPEGFYIYAYINPETGLPYYIGKGKNTRAWNKHRVSVPTDPRFITIMESGLTEMGAWSLERRYIRFWGRIDKDTGILHNQSNGGPGLDSTNSPRAIQKGISTKRTNGTLSRSLETRQKISKTRLEKNIKRTPESLAKQRATKEKRGTLHAPRDPAIIAKGMATRKAKGNTNPNTQETIKKALATKQKNGTLNNSSPEAHAKRKATMLARWGTTNINEIKRLKQYLQ